MPVLWIFCTPCILMLTDGFWVIYLLGFYKCEQRMMLFMMRCSLKNSPANLPRIKTSLKRYFMMQSLPQDLPNAQNLPYLSKGFAAKWGPTKLVDIYPLLNEQKVINNREVNAEDMASTSQSRLREAFSGLCTTLDEASRSEFLETIAESLDESIRFLFSPLASVQHNTLVLPTEAGVQHVPMPSYYQEPPIRTLVKEVHSMQFYSILNALRNLFKDYQIPVSILDPT